MAFRSLLDPFRRLAGSERLSRAALRERDRDRHEGPGEDAGPERCVSAALDWLARAQDRSSTTDGGVARHFSLLSGWGPSYPETTGYIVPTLLHAARRYGRPDLQERARRMLDWLASIQLPGGGFQGGTIDAEPRVPVTFNTGQILLGLAAGVAEWGAPYRPALRAAAGWLVATQDPDGCWRRHPTPFAAPGEKVYETHVAWGLIEAARIDGSEVYGQAARRNLRWATTHQAANGWFEQCCLTDPSAPLTHTIGYALRGLLEGYRFLRDEWLLEAALRFGRGLLGALRDDGRLPGRLDRRWRPTVPWSCLTGSVQVAHCWLLLHEATGDHAFRDAALAANAFVRRTVRLDGDPDIVGGVKGSFPVSGAYGPYQYLNWAAKFFVDANLAELDLLRGTARS